MLGVQAMVAECASTSLGMTLLSKPMTAVPAGHIWRSRCRTILLKQGAETCLMDVL